MISLDGVMQAPGGPKEDTSGGFKYGGWTAPYGDDVYGKVVLEELKPADYLLGGKTFAIWADYWPNHGDFWPGINNGTKYVLSKTMKKSNWKNSVFLKGAAAIRKIKNTKGPDLQVWGSSELVQPIGAIVADDHDPAATVERLRVFAKPSQHHDREKQPQARGL